MTMSGKARCFLPLQLTLPASVASQSLRFHIMQGSKAAKKQQDAEKERLRAKLRGEMRQLDQEVAGTSSCSHPHESV